MENIKEMKKTQEIRGYLKKMGSKLVRTRIGIDRVIAAFIGFFYSFYSLSVFADDDLADVMTSVKGDFGTSSSFIKLLYLAEIIAAVYAYHKTKNIAVLVGILVITIFLTFALGHWVFKG